MSYVKHIEALIKSDQNIKTKHCHGKALPAKALQRGISSDDQFSDETFPDSCLIFPEIVPTESFNSCKVDGCDDCDSYGNKQKNLHLQEPTPIQKQIWTPGRCEIW